LQPADRASLKGVLGISGVYRIPGSNEATAMMAEMLGGKRQTFASAVYAATCNKRMALWRERRTPRFRRSRLLLAGVRRKRLRHDQRWHEQTRGNEHRQDTGEPDTAIVHVDLR
jgi:hypothetical protein